MGTIEVYNKPRLSPMRRFQEATPPATPTPDGGKPASRDGETLKRLMPYLWTYKWRVVAALLLMVGAKVANVGVPVLLKYVVDALDIKTGTAQALLVVPIGTRRAPCWHLAV